MRNLTNGLPLNPRRDLLLRVLAGYDEPVLRATLAIDSGVVSRWFADLIVKATLPRGLSLVELGYVRTWTVTVDPEDERDTDEEYFEITEVGREYLREVARAEVAAIAPRTTPQTAPR